LAQTRSDLAERGRAALEKIKELEAASEEMERTALPAGFTYTPGQMCIKTLGKLAQYDELLPTQNFLALSAANQLQEHFAFAGGCGPNMAYPMLLPDAPCPSTRAPSEDSLATSDLSENKDTIAEMQNSINQVADEVQEWRSEDFEFLRLIQRAPRNHGHVDLMKRLRDGKMVAVKRMPNEWIGTGYNDFIQQHPSESEVPWVDLGVMRYITKKDPGFLCKQLGIFRDCQETFIVSEFATEGDLFSFMSRNLGLVAAREKEFKPMALQIATALQFLHDLGIAHCDVSMENILVTKDARGKLEVRLIDFGAAVPGADALLGLRGKPSYQVPEMHFGYWSPYSLDAFALGVVCFASVLQSYPWMSTAPGRCNCFDFVSENGFGVYLKTRKVQVEEKSRSLGRTFSKDLIRMLKGLLAIRPLDRCSVKDSLNSAWMNDCRFN